ncbi:MAG: discoidin domain-containing protein, partial [Chitinivibrionales bacterium]
MMLPGVEKFFWVFFIAFLCTAYLYSEVSIHVNQVGYEAQGPKTAVFESGEPSVSATEWALVDTESSESVLSGSLDQLSEVEGWSGRYFSVIDFSEFTGSGTFKVTVGSNESYGFSIGENTLFSNTASDAVQFFNGMRNQMDDTNVPFYNNPEETRDVHGGWNDATGDMGKYLSHLAFSNFMPPQQTPMVVWSLLRSYELNPELFSSAALEEAAYGADYLTRILDPEGYFYMIIFDRWGWDTEGEQGTGELNREICTWIRNPDPEIPEYNWIGHKTEDWEAAMREGGGISIAALAKASEMEISGDYSPSEYLDAAERAYEHLKTNNPSYCDNGEENIIDDYCGLMASVELYKATGTETYREDALSRANSLISRLTDSGYLFSDNDENRPYYHAAEEGMPIISLINFMEIDNSINTEIKEFIRKQRDWYIDITTETVNPFNYVRLFFSEAAEKGGGNIALEASVTASSVEEADFPAENAVDGSETTRWSSEFNDDEHFTVDLGQDYMIERVKLIWESAYGSKYIIQVSEDSTTWTDVYEEDSGDGETDEITFSPVNGRYVRLQGVERGMEYAGYSLYEFEVYGENNTPVQGETAFFQPHTNETGYWWQGENARIASMASALLYAQQALDPEYRISDDTLSTIAVSQLDWILGKNPFGLCMMFGTGDTDYPEYAGKEGYAIENVNGGICNGITSDIETENDIEWMPYSQTDPDNASENWRWVEQWLPHNAWYLLAVSRLSHIINLPAPGVSHPGFSKGSGISKIASVTLKPSGNLEIECRKTGNITASLFTLKGRRVLKREIGKGKTLINTAPLPGS